MADTPERVTLTRDGQEISLMPAAKESVGLAALVGGVGQGLTTAVGSGFLNVVWQETNPELKGLKRLFSERETYEFKTKSFNKWTGIGMGIGFAAGAISSAIGAIHHNRELARAVSTPAPGMGQGK